MPIVEDEKTVLVTPAGAALAELTPLAARVKELVDADPIAKRSQKAYAGDWRAFEGWCSGKGLPTEPPAASTLLLYLKALAEEGAKLSTLERAQAGIVHTWGRKGHEWFPPIECVRFWWNLRRSRAELGERTTRKAALTVDLLARVVTALPLDLRGVRDRALLVLGVIGAFRRSELVALDVEDVAFVPDGMIITVRRSKTDQEAKGFEKGIPFAENPALCATKLLRAWLDAADIDGGPLFRRVTPERGFSRLESGSVGRIVKRAVERIGLDSDLYSGHSLRAGFVTSAAEAGRNLPEIKAQTGHASDRIVQGYIRHANLFKKNAAKGLL